MKKNTYFFLLLIPVLFLIVSCAEESARKLISYNEPRDIISLQKGYFQGKFSPDGSKILFTDQSGNGISMYERQTKNLTYYTRATSAGNESYFSPSGKQIYFTTQNFKDRLKTTNLFTQDIQSGERITVVDNIRALKLISQNSVNAILFYQDGQLREFNLDSLAFNDEITVKTGVFIDSDLSLALFQNGESKIINPSGEGNYLWASLSPDQSKILYTLSGKGTFIAEIGGKDITKLGKLNAPKWSPNGEWVIGMVDEDDGSVFTKSDVFLVTADGKIRQNLTPETDVIALFPAFSPDGTAIIFNDEKGMVYLMDVL